MSIMSKEELLYFHDLCREMRRILLRMLHNAQTGHPGSSLSLVEIFAVLYFRVLRIRATDPNWEARDRFIMSKGHGAPSLYVALAARGFFGVEELATFRRFGSRLQGHPVRGLDGIDFTTGSLGQGLSVAVGIAMALRLADNPARVVCLVGDGEMQEGQNWEALAFAAQQALGNLCCIVDRNGLQNDGPTEGILSMTNLPAKFACFGWRVWEVDGHDIESLASAISAAVDCGSVPTVVVANTVKGKGVSFMENQTAWHHHPISKEELMSGLVELE